MNDDIGTHHGVRRTEGITDKKILHNDCIVIYQSISPPEDGNNKSHTQGPESHLPIKISNRWQQDQSQQR